MKIDKTRRDYWIGWVGFYCGAIAVALSLLLLPEVKAGHLPARLLTFWWVIGVTGGLGLTPKIVEAGMFLYRTKTEKDLPPLPTDQGFQDYLQLVYQTVKDKVQDEEHAKELSWWRSFQRRLGLRRDPTHEASKRAHQIAATVVEIAKKRDRLDWVQKNWRLQQTSDTRQRARATGTNHDAH